MASRPVEGSVFPELVLIAHPDSDSRASYADSLRTFGFRVESAANVAEAFERSVLAAPDIVACADDPGLDAAALCRRLRQDPRTRETPVIVLGGGGDEGTPSTVRSGDADSVLAVPCLPETLGAEIRRLLILSRDARLRLLRAQLSAARAVERSPWAQAAPPDRTGSASDRLGIRVRTFLKAGLHARRHVCPACGTPIEPALPASTAACPQCARRRGVV